MGTQVQHPHLPQPGLCQCSDTSFPTGLLPHPQALAPRILESQAHGIPESALSPQCLQPLPTLASLVLEGCLLSLSQHRLSPHSNSEPLC